MPEVVKAPSLGDRFRAKVLRPYRHFPNVLGIFAVFHQVTDVCADIRASWDTD